ncbi:MAG TPA: amidase [Gemmatimonadaceae bacterium]|nr:amidase [Gemmatimonadaceae bacterium]
MRRPNPEPEESSSLSRRAFLGASALAGVAAVTHRDLTPVADLAAHGAAPVRAHAVDELEELSISDVQQGLASGRFTSASLAEQYLGRIAGMDQQGPALRAVLETNPDALAQARALDDERRAKGPRGPLHGVPVLVKDNLATADRMQTTAGSLALVGSKVPRDAFVVAQLRAAGAIILGKTNLSEWANWRSTHSTSGWSGRGGQVRNPYALDRSPSGSSSGTGAAVAANYCTVGIGTETDGSILAPSSAQSLVGIKPTVGLVSRAGIIPIAHSQDTAGPMARSVRDAAIVLGAIAGADARDAMTAPAARHAQRDYTQFLRDDGLKGARIGVAREGFTGDSTPTDTLFNEAIAAMKDAGAIIVDPANLATTGKYGDSEFDVLQYEFKADIAAYLAELSGTSMRTRADLIAYNSRHMDREMPYFGQEIFLASEKRGPLTDDAYRKALDKNHRMARTLGIDATMDRYRLDAIITPTMSPPPLIDLVNGDPRGGESSTQPAAVAGYPSITVPLGYVFEVPVGISFFGRAWSEPVLLRLAYAYEQATKVRKPPKYLATARLD